MAQFVNLTALDGSIVSINPEEVAGLVPIPVGLLPLGVVAGTYVETEDGARTSVQGTVAAVVALLGGSASIQRAIIDGATGAILASTPDITLAVRNGAGDYTITHVAQAGGGALFVGVDMGGAAPLIASIGDTSATTVDVNTVSDAGVATDAVQLSIAIIPI